MSSFKKCCTAALCNENGTSMIQYLFFAGIMIMICTVSVGLIGKKTHDMLQRDALVSALD